MPAQARCAVAVFTALSLLAGCAPPQARDGRIGADDGTDSCRTQLVALDSNVDFFGEDILDGVAPGAPGGMLPGSDIGQKWRGAAIGAVPGAASGRYLHAQQQRNRDRTSLSAAVASDLERENAGLDRAQLAYDQLMDCRFGQAQRIRALVANGSLDRAAGQAQMAQLRERTQREIVLAQAIGQDINKRGAEFDTAVEAIAPGTTKAAFAVRDVPLRGVQVSRGTSIRLRPDAASPDIGSVAARQSVQARPASGNFALVETADGQRGYVTIASFASRRALGTPRVTPAGVSGDVRSLAASNIARRDNFAESVTQAQTAAATGFELEAH
jgi:hypothetical protein